MQSRWRLSAALALALVVGSGLAVGACALSKEGLGSADAAAPDGPTTDASTDTQPVDAPGEVSEAQALCLSLCTMEGGVCEGDSGEQCSIYCTAGGSCPAVQCPPGIPCSVECTGTGACSGGVNCGESSSCTTVCGGATNCGAVVCGGTDCTVVCVGQGACPSTIDCTASNSCTIECSGPGACAGAIHSAAQSTTVACQQPQTCAQPITCSGTDCKVSCIGSGSCAGGECCDAGTCNPSAPQMCPIGDP